MPKKKVNIKSAAKSIAAQHLGNRTMRRHSTFVKLMCLWILTFSSCRGLLILKPEPAQVVYLGSDNMMDVELDLGRLVIPTHGYLSIFIDDQLSAIFCPSRVASVGQCPKSSSRDGEELRGERVQIRTEVVQFGERVLTVEIVDAMGKTVEELSVDFWARQRSEDDEQLLQGCAFNIIIFSKDRACQLDQLLSSFKAHVPNFASSFLRLHVLYTYSTRDFQKGYQQAMSFHPTVNWHKEGNLSASLSSSFFQAHVRLGGDPTGFKVFGKRITARRISFWWGDCFSHYACCSWP
jgi:hypothetical protein